MAKKNKVPKKIAGVKIPKVFRKNALLKGLLGSPAGRKVVANALVAAAGAAATALLATKPAAKAGHAVLELGDDPAKMLRRALKSGAAAMTQAIADAAKAATGEDGPRKERPRELATH